MTTFRDAIRQIFPHAEFLDEPDNSLSSDDIKKAKRIERAYTALVDGLRRAPNQRLATLGRALWDVMHHRHVHSAMYDVPVLTFTVVARDNGPPLGIILVPPPWIEVVAEAPLMGAGGVIYTGSQAVDYYNDRLSTEVSKERAYSYEAEFLKAFRQVLPLNDYQKAVLRDYPEGFDVKKYGYEYRPVAPAPV